MTRDGIGALKQVRLVDSSIFILNRLDLIDHKLVDLLELALGREAANVVKLLFAAHIIFLCEDGVSSKIEGVEPLTQPRVAIPTLLRQRIVKGPIKVQLMLRNRLHELIEEMTVRPVNLHVRL